MSKQGRRKSAATTAMRMFMRRARAYMKEKHGVSYAHTPRKIGMLRTIETALDYTPVGDRIAAAIHALDNCGIDFTGKLDPARKKKQERAAFYESPAWQRLRYDALRENNGRCELCGASKKGGAVLHVDHIKPRSLHPELELELSNLQVLCGPCNLGKGNRCEIDWRAP